MDHESTDEAEAVHTIPGNRNAFRLRGGGAGKNAESMSDIAARPGRCSGENVANGARCDCDRRVSIGSMGTFRLTPKRLRSTCSAFDQILHTTSRKLLGCSQQTELVQPLRLAQLGTTENPVRHEQ